MAIMIRANNKGPGPDGITYEILKIIATDQRADPEENYNQAGHGSGIPRKSHRRRKTKHRR